MSVEAITWAIAQNVKQSSAKFVLVMLANCADGKDFIAWPSVAYLSESTGQDRKTVMENLKRLCESGLIEDAGERKGNTKQVIVYRLNCAGNGIVKESQKRNSTENGTVPKFPSNSPVFPVKESRFSHETVPKTGHGTINEPSIEPSCNHQKKKREAPPFELPDWIPVETWAAFMVARKAKKAASTDFALGLILKDLTKFKESGHDPIDILERSIRGGWSDVYEPKQWATPPTGSGATKPLNKQEALEARNRAVADAWVAEMESKMGVNCETV